MWKRRTQKLILHIAVIITLHEFMVWTGELTCRALCNTGPRIYKLSSSVWSSLTDLSELPDVKTPPPFMARVARIPPVEVWDVTPSWVFTKRRGMIWNGEWVFLGPEDEETRENEAQQSRVTVDKINDKMEGEGDGEGTQPEHALGGDSKVVTSSEDNSGGILSDSIAPDLAPMTPTLSLPGDEEVVAWKTPTTSCDGTASMAAVAAVLSSPCGSLGRHEVTRVGVRGSRLSPAPSGRMSEERVMRSLSLVGWC